MPLIDIVYLHINYPLRRFPKDFSSTIHYAENASSPTYRRLSPEEGGISDEIPFGQGRVRVIDNLWVVPYNPYLALRYR